LVLEARPAFAWRFVEELPDAIEKIAGLAQAQSHPLDATPNVVAWIAAQRWRIERSPELMRRMTEH
jgi:hypothetical protein